MDKNVNVIETSKLFNSVKDIEEKTFSISNLATTVVLTAVDTK